MVPLLALAVGIGIFIMFLGLARTPQTNTAAMVQQRLQVYGGGEQRPLTMEELELQRPFTERFVRPPKEMAVAGACTTLWPVQSYSRASRVKSGCPRLGRYI